MLFEKKQKRLKRITNNTSNYHPENVITNAIIRYQAREVLNEGALLTTKKESKLTNSYNLIRSKLQNTMISFDWIKNYSFEY